MYKIIFLILFGWVPAVFAQSYDAEDPDEAGTAMPNVGITEAEPIVEVVEGVGTVLYANIAFRKAPGLDGPLIRYSAKSEKVLIIGERGEWLKVRMYNNKEAYINKKYVRMAKIFSDESTTVNSMDKKTSFEVGDLINRFNAALKNSPYALKYQAIPLLALTDARKSGGKMTLSFIYSCVDMDGNMIPSYKENILSGHMKKLLELIFVKLLLTNTESYEIVIRVPEFTEEGKVKNTSKVYASVTASSGDVDMEKVKGDGSLIWRYVTSSLPVESLFLKFP